MKKNLLFCGLLVAAFIVRAQNDTLLHQDFQTIDILGDWQPFPLGDDTTWTHADVDGIAPNNGNTDEASWFSANEFWPDTAANTNFVAASYSWLAGSVFGNRNYLNSPPVAITSANATLHWKSASLQMPRYLDGYQVLVSTTGNNPEDFTDTVFTAASMTGILGTGDVPVVDSFEFSPGYIHANGLSDTTYWDYFADSTLLHGILEPHSVSLAAYAGKKIYLAWLHDSDDDYYLSIDDILVLGDLGVNTQSPEAADLRFVTYPNPADNHLNLLYRLDNQSVVQYQVVDSGGKAVISSTPETQAAGEFSVSVDVSKLAVGNHVLVLQVDGRAVASKFLKR